MTSVNVTTTKNTVTVNEGDPTIITVANSSDTRAQRLQRLQLQQL